MLQNMEIRMAKISMINLGILTLYINIEKIPGSTEFRDLTASTWVNTTCRDIQTAIIKTCAYNNRSALKLAFGEEYDKLSPRINLFTSLI